MTPPPIHSSVHSISGMYPGRMIRVQGSCPPCAKRFNINLQYGPSMFPEEDIALHLALYPNNCIVRNHFIDKQWGVEEKNGCMPIKTGDQFEVSVLCEPCGFKVTINGVHFCEFRHRIPFQKISYLTVDGDIMIQQIRIEGAQPGCCGGPQQMYTVQAIPAGMFPGRTIRVKGSCLPGAQRFTINLQCGPNLQCDSNPCDDIALHLGTRFLEMCVVRNHCVAKNWGVEERNGDLPMKRGEQFEVSILCQPQDFKVALNGVHFCEFRHRIPFQRISHVTVEGDVTIQLINIEGAQPECCGGPQQICTVQAIPAGMFPGRTIRVKGSCLPGAQRFTINLQCGPNLQCDSNPCDDIALHLGTRFLEMCVVRNHCVAKNWGVEERNGDLPMKRGEQFEVSILCQPQDFKVALNGVHFCEFRHRIPFQRISHVTVEGDVTIQLINIEGAQPECCGGPQQICTVQAIPAGMFPGRTIRVKGSCLPGAQRFTINLQCGPNLQCDSNPCDDIALHLGTRFLEMCVVRNHCVAKNWGVEERNGDLPMKRGEQFEVSILCQPQDFKVALNGVHFCEFRHRIPFQRISHVTVEGDVTIQLINIEGAQPECCGGPQQICTATYDKRSIAEECG